MDGHKVNDTLINMVTALKPSLKIGDGLSSFNTPTKRPASSNSSMTDDTPTKRFKEENDMFYIGSPREVRRIRADLLDARNCITKLEKQISHMHTVRKEMEIMYNKETQMLNGRCERAKKNIGDLESQLQSIRQRESALQKKLDEVTKKYNELKTATDMELQELQSNNSRLSVDLQKHTSDKSSEITKLKVKVSEFEFIYKAAVEEADAHKLLVDELNKKLAEKTDLENQLALKTQALQKANTQIKELEYAKENFIEFQQQAKMQQHKLSTYSDLERENQRLKEEVKHLKDEVYNKLVLEEEVQDLKNRLVNFKEQEKKFNSLQVVTAQADKALEDFRAFGRAVCETTGCDAALPRLLREFVERLQQQEITLTSEKIQLESKLTTITHDAKSAKDELEKSQKFISNLQSNMKDQKNLMHRLQKKLLLVTGERDSYRKQLDSYERDLTICMLPASSATPGSIQLQTQQERIVGLEKMVTEYRDYVHKLESDLQNAEPGLHADVIPVKVEQVARLQGEVDKLKNENAKLRDRKDQLEIQLEEMLIGYDNAQGRVVHNAKNPLAECLKQRETEKERLEIENERLRKKCKNLEEGLEASKLDITIDHRKSAELEDKLRTSEQQIQRLKDYFKNSMQEFRNVIYMLLGYKVDKNSNHYRLTSVYADNAEDQLCFQLNKDGALNLLHNTFSGGLEEMVELHLRHQKSIPVFLSSLTLELFNNSKTKTYQIDDDSGEDD